MKLTKKEIENYLDDLNRENLQQSIRIETLKIRVDKLEKVKPIFATLQTTESDLFDKPKEFINEAANIIANFHLHSEYIPDALQVQIDSWLKSFTSGEIKTWRSK